MAEILNLQPRGSQAKAYQVKQVRGIIVSYSLAGEPEEDAAPSGDAPEVDVGRTNPEGDHGV